jgi:hypothetical protein
MESVSSPPQGSHHKLSRPSNRTVTGFGEAHNSARRFQNEMASELLGPETGVSKPDLFVTSKLWLVC